MINNTETIIKDGGGGGTTTTPTGNNGNGGTSNTATASYGDGGVSDCNDCNNSGTTGNESYGDGGVCDCNNSDGYNKGEPESPTGNGGTTFVCSECGRTCDCGNMSIESGVCKYCYRPTPDIDEEDEDTTFFCTECEQTYDLSMMSEDPTMCKNCYAKSHTPPVDDEEEEDNTDTEVTEPILVSNISFDRTALAVDEGSNFIIYVTVSPENATDTSLEWSSSDNEVATVTSEGFVAAWKAGEAIITATARDGSGVSKTCHVTVRPIPVNKVTVEPKSVTLAAGEKAYLYAEVCPCDASNQKVNWYSNLEGIASVDDGVVIAHSDGVATITAISEDGSKRDTCTVTVDSRERVVVEKDSHSFVVKFEDGNIWKNIGLDISRREENYGAMFPVDFDREYYEDLIPEEQRYLDNIYVEENGVIVNNSYTEKQIGFLYLLDPLGIEYYMRHNACQDMSLGATLFFKDRVYKEIFGVWPRLIKVFPDKTIEYYVYTPSISADTRADYYTDAEILFGEHAIYDTLSWISFLLDVVPSVSLSLFSMFYPPVGVVLSGIELVKFLFFSASASGVLSSGSSYVMEKYTSNIYTLSGGESAGEKAGKAMGWVNFVLGAFSTIRDAAEVFTPSINDITTYNRINASDYRVNYNVSGSELSMEDIILRIS